MAYAFHYAYPEYQYTLLARVQEDGAIDFYDRQGRMELRALDQEQVAVSVYDADGAPLLPAQSSASGRALGLARACEAPPSAAKCDSNWQEFVRYLGSYAKGGTQSAVFVSANCAAALLAVSIGYGVVPMSGGAGLPACVIAVAYTAVTCNLVLKTCEGEARVDNPPAVKLTSVQETTDKAWIPWKRWSDGAPGEIQVTLFKVQVAAVDDREPLPVLLAASDTFYLAAGQKTEMCAEACKPQKGCSTIDAPREPNEAEGATWRPTGEGSKPPEQQPPDQPPQSSGTAEGMFVAKQPCPGIQWVQNRITLWYPPDGEDQVTGTGFAEVLCVAEKCGRERRFVQVNFTGRLEANHAEGIAGVSGFHRKLEVQTDGSCLVYQRDYPASLSWKADWLPDGRIVGTVEFPLEGASLADLLNGEPWSDFELVAK